MAVGAAGEREGAGTRTRADAWQTYSRLAMRLVRYVHDIVVELYLVRSSYALVRSEMVMPQSMAKVARKLGVYVSTVALDAVATDWLVVAESNPFCHCSLCVSMSCSIRVRSNPAQVLS